ncbi:hypothetical protein BT96DRAFT_146360 [Gymnopus androsaceus JB14]|uniref:DUF6534 domain-containing protein n=1 Tax=Gymnopus androsaceus JB14 TaxID=1447944 RepID=A0A6A4HDW5_9AGAR|nr:hypothetical protein BT96DRAFT_146360 [Gymnopus androsaceus JB14]
MSTIIYTIRPLIIQVLVGDIITIIIHVFFAWRIYLLSAKKLIVPSIICLLVLVQFVLALVWVIKLQQLKLIIDLPTTLNMATAATSTDMIGDAMVTISMIYYLRKNRTSFKQTKHIINTLVTYTVNTGLLTIIFTSTSLLLLTIRGSPNSLLFAPFFLIEFRLYACSFMSVLNSRTELKGERDNIILISSSNGLSHPRNNMWEV